MTEHENQTQDTSASPSDVVESVRDLIDMMMKGGIGELDLKAGDVKIRLRSESVALAAAAPVFSMPSAAGGYPAPQAIAPQIMESTLSSDLRDSKPTIEGHLVTSPMIGTYYSASAPGEPPFLNVGDEVETGQVIGIIEAMKIMNEITADQSGVVVEILVENAEAVEYGTPLIRVSSSARLD